MKRFMSFSAVGAVGFGADAGGLTVLVRFLQLDPFFARVLSIAFALTVTWLLNRSVTFNPSERGMAAEGVRYGSIGIGTSVFNYCFYCAVLVIVPPAPPLAALIVSSAVTMLLSFLGYSRFVYDR